MRLNRTGCLKLKKKMLKKFRKWVMWIFTKSPVKAPEDAHYFDAKHFHNDLENQEDYYLKVVRGGENEFVRRDEVDDN